MNNRELASTQPGNMTRNVCYTNSVLVKREKSERWLVGKGLITRSDNPSLPVWASRVPGAREGRRWHPIDPPELELQRVESHHGVQTIKPSPLEEQQCS